MFCPRCGQERISEETSFCSRCGFLLTAVNGLLSTGGASPAETLKKGEKAISPRSRGIRQGLFMFLLTFVIAPIVGIVSQFGLGIEPWPVGVVVFGLGVGGLLRIAYAMMFESRSALANEDRLTGPDGQKSVSSPARQYELTDAAQPSVFQSSRGNDAHRTSDLQPHSVTDHTTKLLEKE